MALWSFDPAGGPLGALRADAPGLDAAGASGAGSRSRSLDSGLDRTHQSFGGWDCARTACFSSRGDGRTGLADPATWTPESEPAGGVRRPDLGAAGVDVRSARTLTGGVASGVPRLNAGEPTGTSGKRRRPLRDHVRHGHGHAARGGRRRPAARRVPEGRRRST